MKEPQPMMMVIFSRLNRKITFTSPDWPFRVGQSAQTQLPKVCARPKNTCDLFLSHSGDQTTKFDHSFPALIPSTSDGSHLHSLISFLMIHSIAAGDPGQGGRMT